MDPTLKALAGLLLKAVPTVFFLVLLTVYLKYIFFKPLERILKERHEATEGARKLAEEAFANADKKASEFDRALQAARIELHREQEMQRQAWIASQNKALAAARAEADARIEEAKLNLAAEVDRTTTNLAQEAESLAEQIIRSLVRRKAA